MLEKIIPLEMAAPEHSSSSDVLKLDTEGKLPLTAQSFTGQRIAILGTSGMGKSNTLALILEKTLPFMPTVIFDQHDEFWGLCEQYEILRVGKSPESQLKAGVEQAAQIAEISHSKRLSVLVEMLNMSRQERQDFVEAYCAAIWELNKRAKLPYGIVLEEAQNFIPEGKSTPAQEMMKQFALEGRKFGFTIFISTQRSAEVSKTVLGQCGLAFLHGVDIYADVQAYAGMLPFSATETKKIALNLGIGECIVKVKTEGRAQFIQPVKMLRRETFHVGDTPTLDQASAPPLRAIDAELLKELKDLLKPPQTPPRRPGGEQSGVLAVRAFTDLCAAYVESCVADLRAKLEAANREIARLKATDKARLVPTQANGQPSAGVIAHVIASRQADVQLNTTSDVNWNGRSDLATQRAKNKQQREFDSLMTVVRELPVMYRRILVYLTQREEMNFTEAEITRYLGYSRKTFESDRPLRLIRMGLVERKLSGGKYTYKSTARKHLEGLCPDLDIEPFIERIKKLERI